MRPQLGAFRGVQGPLKEGAENGGFDAAPVFAGGLAQALQGRGAEFHGVRRVEQIAVEPGDFRRAEHSAAGHPGEQVAHRPIESGGIPVFPADQVGKELVGQQAGILGVEAEHQLIQVAGQAFRILVALLHIGHNIPEQVGGFPGDFLYRPVGAQIGRGKKGAAEQLQLFRLGQVGQGNIVPRRHHPRKVGLDPDRAERGYDKQRRRLEVNLIAEQLLHGRVQVGVAALELPAEPLLQVGIGKAARHPLLKGESLRIAVFPRGGMAHQAAKIQKHLLRRLLFAELNAHPLADERLREQARRLRLGKERHNYPPAKSKAAPTIADLAMDCIAAGPAGLLNI